jgi:hypothetical protein
MLMPLELSKTLTNALGRLGGAELVGKLNRSASIKGGGGADEPLPPPPQPKKVIESNNEITSNRMDLFLITPPL